MARSRPFVAFGVSLVLLVTTGRPDGYAESAEPAPVLVELFTSEGCSSCPPADAVLADLDRHQPVGAARVIALELHVDYWDDLGWKDPFSSGEHSARQTKYAAALSRSLSVYTPQMVVDGKAQLNGSSRDKAVAAIAAAASAPKAKMRVGASGDLVTIVVSDLPPVTEGDVAEVWLGASESELRTEVGRGENAGRTVVHGPVVRQLRRVGVIAGTAFRVEASVEPPKSAPRERLRAVAFIQERRSRRILGSAEVSLK